METQYKKMFITPELAKEMLSTNIDNNRRIRNNLLNQYVTLMDKGLWINYHPEAIMISPDNTLLDGQHRLMAIIKSGKSYWFNVAITDISVMATLNTGGKRSPGDACKVAGIPNSNLMASIIKIENDYYQNGSFHLKFKNGSGISHVEIIDKYYSEKEHYDKIATLSIRYYTRGRLLTQSYIGGFLTVLLKNESNFIIDFFEQLTTGLGIQNNNIHLLRQRLINELSAMKKTPIGIINALVIKAYNASIEGKEYKCLSFNPLTEPYPQLK